MAEEQRIIPVDAPPSPAFSDAYVVKHLGGFVTVYFLRVPPVFNEAQQERLYGGPELHAPVVASTTIPMEIAEKLATSIQAIKREAEQQK